MPDKKESTEDYIEKILMLKEKQGSVRAIDLASFMNFSKASVSIALKKLKEENLIIVNKDTGDISLTEIGYERAASTYEKHKILSSLLMSLGLPENLALQDACKVEHDISDEAFALLKDHYYKHLKQ